MGMKCVYIALLTFSFIECFAQKHTVNGYVKDKASGEALIGANIYNNFTNFGTSTNTLGFYSATFKKDSIQLIFSYVGYEIKKIDLLLDRDTVINVELDGNALLQELVVSAESFEPGAETALMSSIRLRADQLANIPALLGETDLIRSLQMVPGVHSGSEGSSGIYVRGGGPDQNLILLDGVPIYNASHLFGFFSIFNPDAINSIHLIKGGFPARYGGRLSSVVDISMKEGSYKSFKGQGSVGLISSKLTLEGPIAKDKTSFLVSARRTYIDALAYPIMEYIDSDNVIPRYFFYDLNIKLNHKISTRDHIYLSAYSGKDKAYSSHDQKFDNSPDFHREEYGLKWGNQVAAFSWNRAINKKLFSNVLLSYSKYKFDLFEEFEENTSGGTTEFYKGEYISGIEDMGIKFGFEYMPDINRRMHFGGSFIDHTFKPGAIHFQSFWEADTTWGSSNTYARELSMYVENDYNINNRLKLNFGLHYSGFFVEGKYYHSLQPRLSSKLMLGKTFSFAASYADMTQYIHLLTNSGIGLPTDLWVPATSTIRPQRAVQYAAGFSRKTPILELSLEGFYKDMDNLIEYKEGATFLHIDQNWQDKIVSGKGNSYGVEFLAHKSAGSITGLLGYTMSWTNREFKNLYGKVEKFPYRYDRRHDLSATMSIKIRENTNFSWSWVFGSGAAITLPQSSYISMYPGYASAKDVWMVETEVFSKRNSYRMRDYHRLDLGISFTRETRWGERTWHIGTYNSYNRRNPYFIDMGRDRNNHRKFIQRSLFPIIPSVSYSFKF
jgi:outer membrane receptor for ferrienterochelin and colicin